MGDDDSGQGEQSVLQTIRLMLLCFSALFSVLLVIIGFIGFGSLREIQNTAGSVAEIEVGKLLSTKAGESAGLSETLEKLTTDTKRAQERLENLAGRLDAAEHAMGIVDGDAFDIVGDYLRLAEELDEAGIGKTLVTQREQRERARVVLQRLSETGEGAELSSDDAVEAGRDPVLADIFYNAAGTASSLQMADLASALASRSWNAQKSPEHETRMYRAQMEAGELEEEKGFSEVVRVLNGLDRTHNIHLTLSESYNVAVKTGLLSEMTNSLSELAARLGDRSPSYLFVVRARLRLLVGFREDVEGALADIRTGLEMLSTESPNAAWFDSAVSGSRQLLGDLEKHPGFSEEARELRSEYRPVLEAKTDSVGAGGELDSWTALFDALTSPVSVSPQTEFPSPPEVVSVSLDGPLEVLHDGWHWFAFVAETSGHVVVNASVAGLDIDPVVVVYDDGGGLVSWDDDGGEYLGSRVELEVDEGTRYSIGVGPAVGNSVRGAIVSVERE